MGKLKVHQFDPCIYPRKIFIVKGAGAKEDIRNAFRTHDDDSLNFDGSETCKAGVWNVQEQGERRYFGVLIWLREQVDIETIAHESVHAANLIFNDLGINYNTLNDEHFAYLVGFIADCIWQTWTGKFKDD